jgi:hypothetical protein
MKRKFLNDWSTAQLRKSNDHQPESIINNLKPTSTKDVHNNICRTVQQKELQMSDAKHVAEQQS